MQSMKCEHGGGGGNSVSAARHAAFKSTGGNVKKMQAAETKARAGKAKAKAAAAKGRSLAAPKAGLRKKSG